MLKIVCWKLCFNTTKILLQLIDFTTRINSPIMELNMMEMVEQNQAIELIVKELVFMRA